MNQLELHTPEGRTRFAPGEEIVLDTSWELDEPPERIELRVVWNTAGKGTTDLSVVQTVPVESPQPRETRRIEVVLPRQPYSFSGQLISLIWALELVAIPSETSTRQEITIAPAGREVRLGKVEESISKNEWFSVG